MGSETKRRESSAPDATPPSPTTVRVGGGAPHSQPALREGEGAGSVARGLGLAGDRPVA